MSRAATTHLRDRGSLADAAYHELLGQILDGDLAADSPLRMSDLQDRLGVSHTPIREALARLEGEGQVTRDPMRGFRVSPPLTSHEFLELMVARKAIEPMLASLAANGITPQHSASLHSVFEASRNAPAGATFTEFADYLRLSAEFHSTIAMAAGNRFLSSAVSTLPGHVQRFRLFHGNGITDRDVSIDEHSQILRAIASRNSDGARLAMLNHLDGVCSRAVPLEDESGPTRVRKAHDTDVENYP